MNDPEWWNNSSSEPLSNGPMRSITPPESPQHFLTSDGRLYEFLVPFPFHIFDQAPWRPLVVELSGRTFVVERPVLSTTLYQPDERWGNESPDTYCTIIRVMTPDPAPIDQDAVWRLVESLLGWLRIKARHFWLLHGVVGYGSLYRGTVFGRTGMNITQKNYSVSGPACVVRPLSELIWLTVKHELETKQRWPLAESVFCDALLSLVAGDRMKAALEAGVSSEVAITQLLDAASIHRPTSSGAIRWVKKSGERNSFFKKLTEWPARLGLQPVDKYLRPGLPPSWVPDVLEGYQQRNGVAHSGKIAPAIADIDVCKFIFATNAILQYCRDQRGNMGMSNYSMPLNLEPYQQLRAYHGGGMRIDTNELCATFT